MLDCFNVYDVIAFLLFPRDVLALDYSDAYDVFADVGFE